MDSGLEGRYPAKAARRIAQLALNCLESEHKHRPHMKDVVITLERIEAAKDRPVEPRARPNLSMARQKFKQPLRNRPLHDPVPSAR